MLVGRVTRIDRPMDRPGEVRTGTRRPTYLAIDVSMVEPNSNSYSKFTKWPQSRAMRDLVRSCALNRPARPGAFCARRQLEDGTMVMEKV
jgi:hypothetical protein